ncbi:glutathione S-transferase family protein [Erythrobacter sp. GH1-10]|uniref:glutathione S-transferase family protein n=1 Tax=Erythrobacter sp. GH1-10 TaxID=3349334 RepID=UPI003877F055
MTGKKRLEFFGNPSSPYSRKMLALLRYRHIPHSVMWGSPASAPEGYPRPKVGLLPTFYFPTEDNGLEAMVDSTPIAQRLEREYPGRSAMPADPELAFYAALLEDYADEWLTKPMFHYRWHHSADREHAGRFLAFTSDTTLEGETADAAAGAFTKRQFERLYVVGSNVRTANAIEASYRRFVTLLDGLLAKRHFMLGDRPSIADFAIYGQLTQLGLVDPTPRATLLEHAPRLEAWIWMTDDLAGLKPEPGDWMSASAAREELAPLIGEIARTYLPVLIANARAVTNQEQVFTTEVCGSEWTQPTFSYHAKCLSELRAGFAALPANAKSAASDTLRANGCAALIEEQV